MHKFVIMLMLSCMSCICFAKHMHRPIHRPHNVHHHVHHRPIHHSPKHVHHGHRHHHHSIIPFTIGALTGYTVSQLITTPQPKPVIVQQPIVVAPTQTTVWEPGHYENQIQPNGTIISVWIPGRYVMKVITP